MGQHSDVAYGLAGGRIVEYDALRRRLWIAGQRCHHGATGSFLALLACLGLIAERERPRAPLVGLVGGGLLMVHDWKDRSIWFERGRGTQP